MGAIGPIWGGLGCPLPQRPKVLPAGAQLHSPVSLLSRFLPVCLAPLSPGSTCTAGSGNVAALCYKEDRFAALSLSLWCVCV